MELLLNLCWLAISLCAFGVWHSRASLEEGKSSRQIRVEGVALFCALILLFFPISITDDLHPEIFLTTDCSADRSGSPTLSAGKTPVVPAATAFPSSAAVVPSVLSILPAAVFVGLPGQCAAACESFSPAPGRGRAPPQV